VPEEKANEPIAINLKKLIEYAREGRKEVLPVLRRALEERPSLWQDYGNLARQAQSHWLNLIGGQDLYFSESMARHAATLRADLAGEDASPLEQLQVERIVALNLQVGYYEALVAKHEGSAARGVLEYLHERHGVADRRLQQAMVNLARLRRLLPGVLKVDVVISGEVQANINQTPAESGESNGGQPTRIRVPQNRVKDLLAAATN
jgi:hypothetical protein